MTKDSQENGNKERVDSFNSAAEKPTPKIATSVRLKELERQRRRLDLNTALTPPSLGRAQNIDHMRRASARLEFLIEQERTPLQEAKTQMQSEFQKEAPSLPERQSAYRKAREARQEFRRVSRDRDDGLGR